MADLRFPDVDRILPGPRDAATRLRLDPADARFLLDALGRLPGADEPNAPATVDLNGKIAVRARAAGEGPATELVLSRSAYTGPPVRLQTNREFLARAIRLGFTEVEVVDADTPAGLPGRPPGPGLAAAGEGLGDRAGRRRDPHRVRLPTIDAAGPDSGRAAEVEDRRDRAGPSRPADREGRRDRTATPRPWPRSPRPPAWPR